MSDYDYKQVNEEEVSAVTATPSVDLGTQRVYSGNVYTYGYNAGITDATQNTAVVLSTGSTGYSFTGYWTYTDGTYIPAPNFFGVAKNATITAGSYGWVATRGFVDVMAETGIDVVAGDAIAIGPTAGRCKAQTFTSLLTQNVQNRWFGHAMQSQDDADSTTGHFTTYIR